MCTSKYVPHLQYNFSGMGKYEEHIKQGWYGNFEGNYVRGHHNFGGRFTNEQLRLSFSDLRSYLKKTRLVTRIALKTSFSTLCFTMFENL